jgi:hypothetical protein
MQSIQDKIYREKQIFLIHFLREMIMQFHIRRRALAIVLSFFLLPMSTALTPAQSQKENGFQRIFNGENLEGWDGDPEFWSVKNGAIVGQKPKGNPGYNTFIVWEEAQPEHFELKLEFKIDSGNSGIQYRSKRLEKNKYRMHGYQGDVDHAGKYIGLNYDEGGRGILAHRGEKVVITKDGTKKNKKIGSKKALLKKIDLDAWNEYHIIARGNRLVHKINGQVMSVVVDHQEADKRGGGYIGFQLHQGMSMKISFRNIRIKPLSAPGRTK